MVKRGEQRAEGQRGLAAAAEGVGDRRDRKGAQRHVERRRGEADGGEVGVVGDGEARVRVEDEVPRRRRQAEALVVVELEQRERQRGGGAAGDVKGGAKGGERLAAGVRGEVRQHERAVQDRRPRGGVAQRDELVGVAELRRVQQVARRGR